MKIYLLSISLISFLLPSLAFAAPNPWPQSNEWSILTHLGAAITDREAGGQCTDPSNGGTEPSGTNDIGSQAVCTGSTKYNPGLLDEQFGNGLQPNANNLNTFSAATYYSDPLEDSNVCSNISDDALYFRLRLAQNPLQNNAAQGLSNDFWWATLDVDNNGVVDFYVRVNGNKSISGSSPNTTENIQLLYETSGDDDPTGEPVIYTVLNPLNTGFAIVSATPDNGVVGNSNEYFLDWQLPVTAFKTNSGTQLLCEGNNLVLTNYSTSANANDPFQKDRLQAYGEHPDLISLSNHDYQMTKSAVDLNGGDFLANEEIEYVVTVNNLGGNLTNFVFTDQLDSDATYVDDSLKIFLGSDEYSLSDAVDSPDIGSCPDEVHCEGDFNDGTNTVNVHTDWLYATGVAAPLYDEITIKYRVVYGTSGFKSNQASTTVREINLPLLSDDPDVNDVLDCDNVLYLNCNDGITENDEPTIIEVGDPLPSTDLEISTNLINDDEVLQGDSLAFSITVDNLGPEDADNVGLTDNFDSDLQNINWTCTATGGAVCPVSGVGNMVDVPFSIPVGGQVIFSIAADIYADSTEILNTATVSVSEGLVDNELSNNSIDNNLFIAMFDFGDSPDPFDGTSGSYPSLLANDGARHKYDSSVYMGTNLDWEFDSYSNVDASGDDTNGDDDDDGIGFVNSLVVGEEGEINVSFSTNGYFNAWIDFNADGDFDDNGEQIFDDTEVSTASNMNLFFSVPADSAVGKTFARFRFNSRGGLSSNGYAPDGEVEDYLVTIIGVPNLSTSFKSADKIEVKPDDLIIYSINIVNSGTRAGTDISFSDALDASLENPVLISTSPECGAPMIVIGADSVDAGDISILAGETCRIDFQVDVIDTITDGYEINNTASISAALEGGSAKNVVAPTVTVSKVTVPTPTPSTGGSSGGSGGSGSVRFPDGGKIEESVGEKALVDTLQSEAIDSFEKNHVCLAIDLNRQLKFVDLSGDNISSDAAITLKSTYQTDSGDYILSGYNSTLQDSGMANVGLQNDLSRLEWAKMLMISHCLKIQDHESIPKTTISGKSLPIFKDLALEVDDYDNDNSKWYKDVMYSAAYYEILDGTHEGNSEFERFITVAEAIKMVVRAKGALWNLTSEKIVRDSDNELETGNLDAVNWYQKYYEAAKNEGVFEIWAQDLTTKDRRVKRESAFAELLTTLEIRDLYESIK